MSSLLPVHTADQITSGVTEYLTTSFSLADTATGDRLAEFLTDEESGMFHGPYVRTRLPYAPDDSGQRFFDWQPPSFIPYRHQAEAFRRLASLTPTGEQRRPDPTLVITGTGSGKTESFLYPILEHCRRNPGRGMKALILYPMNALATDQERRLAEIIS
ncbi:MAG: DEAD/DEAH box helicase, partial [Candidatus Corynebacterium faecigallinarum]